MNAAHLYRESGLMDDKRNFERVSMEVPVLIECLRPKRRKRLILTCTNLSASGAYFNTPKTFPKGAEVKVEIFLYDKDHASCPVINVTGRVVRSERQGMAISFNEDYDITTMEESARPIPSSPPLPPLRWGKGLLHLNDSKTKRE